MSASGEDARRGAAGPDSGDPDRDAPLTDNPWTAQFRREQTDPALDDPDSRPTATFSEMTATQRDQHLAHDMEDHI